MADPVGRGSSSAGRSGIDVERSANRGTALNGHGSGGQPAVAGRGDRVQAGPAEGRQAEPAAGTRAGTAGRRSRRRPEDFTGVEGVRGAGRMTLVPIIHGGLILSHRTGARTPQGGVPNVADLGAATSATAT